MDISVQKVSWQTKNNWSPAPCCLPLSPSISLALGPQALCRRSNNGLNEKKAHLGRSISYLQLAQQPKKAYGDQWDHSSSYSAPSARLRSERMSALPTALGNYPSSHHIMLWRHRKMVRVAPITAQKLIAVRVNKNSWKLVLKSQNRKQRNAAYT